MLGLDKLDIMSKQEIDFIKFIVRPLWTVYNQYCTEAMSEAISNIEINIKEWEKIIESERRKMQKKDHENP